MRTGKTYASVDEYIRDCPGSAGEMLKTLRALVKREAPRATETIAYNIPTYKLNGVSLLHFAAFTTHIGFYPTPSGIRAFASELRPYKPAKGSIRFSIGKPLPLPLIRRIVIYRVKEVQSG